MSRARSMLAAASAALMVGLIPAAHAQVKVDPAAIERGKDAYGSNCGFCHGSMATGTEQAPNLTRSPLVRSDVNGDTLTPFLKTGRPLVGMPAFGSLLAGQISDIIAFLHSRAALARGHRDSETSLLVGDAKEGQSYFSGAGGCSGCHSVTGDLAHIGSKYSPLGLTTAFLTPTAKPLQAKIPLPSGQTVTGAVTYY